MRMNRPMERVVVRTHEGGRAMQHQTPLTELKRAVATCLLWENTFYEKGSDIAARIQSLAHQVTSDELAQIAISAREDMKLRHVPLFLVRELARHEGVTRRGLIADTLVNVIRRPDEMGEFLALYDGDTPDRPLSAQVKKGLARAFTKFSAYQLAKWNRDAKYKLRDVMFLVHPKPKNADQAATWKQLVDKTLEPPETWEVLLSTGRFDTKAEAWTYLLKENKLGDMATLMNLRNMDEAGVNPALIAQRLQDWSPKSVALPFRFVSAAKTAPRYVNALSAAMVKAITPNALDGDTAVVVDVSGSMEVPISAKSVLDRWEAAAALAVLIRESVKGECRVFTFSTELREVPNYRGLALVDAIGKSPRGGTHLAQCLDTLQNVVKFTGRRLIVVTDEQAHAWGVTPREITLPKPWTERAYIINVASYKPGLDTNYGWQRINGWSERIVDWISLDETGHILQGEEEE